LTKAKRHAIFVKGGRPPKPAMGNFGSRVRERRLKLGLTLRELGELAGLSESELSLIERNERSPRFETGMKIAQALGMKAEDLYRTPRRKVPA